MSNNLGKRDSMAWVTFQSLLQGGARPHSDVAFKKIITEAYSATDQFMEETNVARNEQDAKTKARFEEQNRIEQELY